MWNSVNSVRWLLLLALLLLAACASVDPVVKVGLVAPFVGKQRQIGYDAIYSARLAVREINAAGGIGGYRVALVALDDGGDAEMAAKTAAALVRDPAVVAVIGHWLAASSAAGTAVYQQAAMPYLQMGSAPFLVREPAQLPADFRAAYAAVTPFDEEAGPYAGSTYDAMQLLWQALALAAQDSGRIDRETVKVALSGLQYDGLTGTVYANE